MRAEPRLAQLVGTVVASLRVAGLSPVPVTDPHGRHWDPAYVLGSLEPDKEDSTAAVAEVVLDGSGRMVRNHPVRVTGRGHRLIPISCPSLADGYERLVRAIRIAEEPRGDAMVLTRHGDLMITGPGSRPVALSDYLNDLRIRAVAHVGAHRL
jgi:hypothetical protein